MKNHLILATALLFVISSFGLFQAATADTSKPTAPKPKTLTLQQIDDIFAAAKIGDWEQVINALKKNPELAKSTDDAKKTLLQYAVEASNAPAVEALLKAGADIAITDKQGMTPLHTASEIGSLDVVKILLEYKPDISARNKLKQTPLILAALNGHAKVAALLIENGATSGVKLIDAVISGDEEKIKALLGDKPEIDQEDMVTGGTALHWAARAGNTALCKILLSKGASVESTDKDRNTPLHYAATLASPETLKVLVDAGGNIHAKNKINRTVLFFACEASQTEIVRYLITKDASVTDVDRLKFTPLHLAAKAGNSKIAKMLVGKGASVKARALRNTTVLHLGVESGDTATVGFLLEKDADIKRSNSKHFSALGIATNRRDVAMIKFLLSRGAKPGWDGGMTAFGVAVTNGDIPMMKALMNGASKISRSRCGQTWLLHMAVAKNDKEMAGFLLTHGIRKNELDNRRRSAADLAYEKQYYDLAKFLSKRGSHLYKYRQEAEHNKKYR